MRSSFFRFRLRQLLILLAVLAALLAILAPRLRLERETRRAASAVLQRAATQEALNGAVQGGDLDTARRALDAGADVNWAIVNSAIDRKPLLHHAITAGDVSMVELLLEFGAEVNAVAPVKGGLVASGPPLLAAVAADHSLAVRRELIELLVERGADPGWETNDRDLMAAAVYRRDADIADVLREIGVPYGVREMVAFNRLAELRAEVEKRPDVVRERLAPTYAARPGQEPTPLGMALSHGHRAMALYLVEQDAPLDTIEQLGQTLLHLAARGGDPHLVRLLVDRGLDVDARDDYQDTPLVDSASRSTREALAVLVEAGADVNARGSNGRTALHYAAAAGRSDVVELLLKAGADPQIADLRGRTAIEMARPLHLKLVRRLEEAMGVAPSTAD